MSTGSLSDSISKNDSCLAQVSGSVKRPLRQSRFVAYKSYGTFRGTIYTRVETGLHLSELGERYGKLDAKWHTTAAAIRIGSL